MDVALWFLEAVRQYFDVTHDTATLSKLYPAATQIINAHIKGTRYHIHVHEADGLLYACENGVQLTWMDAKVGDWVVTPRIAKPVEVNALWYNALNTMVKFAPIAGKSWEPFQRMADMDKQSFAKFWNAVANCCYDVIDDPRLGNDSSLRPHQIFAVSLPESPLSPEQQKDRRGRLRAQLSHVARSARSRYRGSRLAGALWRRPSRTQRCLSPRQGLGLSHRTLRTRALARLRRSMCGCQFARASGQTSRFTRPRYAERNI